MTEPSINFSGITHDHTLTSSAHQRDQADGDNATCSTITILRRHPMYDCLVLVKKFRSCLSGYTLEFPTSKAAEEEDDENSPAVGCNTRRLVSKFLDGDDPIYQHCKFQQEPTGAAANQNMNQEQQQQQPDLSQPFAAEKIPDQDGELVHVPINGLLDRLKGFTQSGVAVDSRVYAFAMGLKTAERILTTSSMKELQETPI